MPERDNPTVWSSEHGDLRKKNPRHAVMVSLPPKQQTAYLHRDSKRRGGKTVILIKNLVLCEEDLKVLAKQPKQISGSGGTIKDGIIEIQGDHREKIGLVLMGLGYKVKLAGG